MQSVFTVPICSTSFQIEKKLVETDEATLNATKEVHSQKFYPCVSTALSVSGRK
jgi:hypothetical protein